LRAGDESTIMCAYLQNDGGGKCHYHNDSDLLQEIALDQLKERIARKHRVLKLCVRYPRASSPDYVWPLRREIRELEKTLKHYTDWIEREGLKIRKPRPRVVAEQARSRHAARGVSFYETGHDKRRNVGSSDRDPKGSSSAVGGNRDAARYGLC
jgi:hypothetical protein